MLKLAIGDVPRFSVCEIERGLTPPTYTANTLDADSGDGYLKFRFDPGESVFGRGDSGGPVVDASGTTRFAGKDLEVPVVAGVNSHLVNVVENPDHTYRTVYGTVNPRIATPRTNSQASPM